MLSSRERSRCANENHPGPTLAWLLVSCLLCLTTTTATTPWSDLDLPHRHLLHYFHNQPHLRQQCLQDNACPYKIAAGNDSRDHCWGYEEDCPQSPRLPECPGDSKRWTDSKESQRQKFWETADFGFLRQKRDEIKSYCTPKKPGDSSLSCVNYLRYCRATNIYIDLKTANLKASSNPYREDVLKKGQIGGKCKLNKAAIDSQMEHKSPLQSWAAEIQNFISIPQTPMDDDSCDVVITKPTFIIKLDATVNMYHHFCDYVNLYISQHFNNSFSKDVNILLWDTSGHSRSAMFAETWAAYSNAQPILLNQYDGKRICFKEAVFSFLARMRWGLYYNMPLIPGCEGSSLMKAFSHHIMHRLHIPQYGPLEKKIRVTLISRSTKYRQIQNEDELVRALQTDFEFEVRKVNFARTMPFLEQLEVSHNSDILIGIHGAGLTHLLFQPDWAVIIELYNCEDADCYKDLARLRGTRYMTWQDKAKLQQEDEGHHPTMGAHAKFTNYAFDVAEFMRLIRVAASHVRSHPDFVSARRRKYSSPSLSASSACDADDVSDCQKTQAPEEDAFKHTEL